MSPVHIVEQLGCLADFRMVASVGWSFVNVAGTVEHSTSPNIFRMETIFGCHTGLGHFWSLSGTHRCKISTTHGSGDGRYFLELDSE